MADIIRAAGKYCPNLMRLELPTENWTAIHGDQDIEDETPDSNNLLVVTAFAQNVRKMEKIVQYRISCLV